MLYSGMDEGKNHERGVGLITSKDAAQAPLELEPVSERIIRARLNLRWQQVTVIQCYAPTNEATEEEKDDFYEQLQAVMEQGPRRDVKIVMKDMNVACKQAPVCVLCARCDMRSAKLRGRKARCLGSFDPHAKHVVHKAKQEPARGLI